MRVEERPVTLGDGDAHALEEVALPAVGGPAALALRLLLLLAPLVLLVELAVDDPTPAAVGRR